MRRVAGWAVGVVVSAGLVALPTAASASPGALVVGPAPLAQGAQPGSCKHPNYSTVQGAINAAASGAVIHVCTGTYVEQLNIAGKNLKLMGAGQGATTITAPAVLSADGDGKHNLVEVGSLTGVGGPVNVSMKLMTLTGPGPGPCGSIDSGIAVVGGSTLSLALSTIRDIRDSPIGGCQNGEGVRAGTQRYITNDPQVGHVTVVHTTVTGYQKNGIVISGTGSSGALRHNTIATSNPGIASNGVEVIGGGKASVSRNQISGNECDIPSVCGAAFTTESQGAGILLIGPGTPTTLSNNTVSANDEGVYTDTGIKLSHNDVSGNRYEGIFVDSGATGFVSAHDVATGDGNYGIYMGPSTGSTAGEAGTFSHDTAQGNAVDDFFWDGDGTLHATRNICGSAAPSLSAWGC